MLHIRELQEKLKPLEVIVMDFEIIYEILDVDMKKAIKRPITKSDNQTAINKSSARKLKKKIMYFKINGNHKTHYSENFRNLKKHADLHSNKMHEEKNLSSSSEQPTSLKRHNYEKVITSFGVYNQLRKQFDFGNNNQKKVAKFREPKKRSDISNNQCKKQTSKNNKRGKSGNDSREHSGLLEQFN